MSRSDNTTRVERDARVNWIKIDSIRLSRLGSPHEQLDGPIPGLTVSDVGDLYRRFSGNLMRIVRAGVRSPEAVTEDACQLAWSRLLHHRDRVRREAALSWLVTTALHEASRLVRRSDREMSFEAAIADGADFTRAPREPSPLAVAEARERLRSLTQLPRRQQRLLWLRGVGLSYEEIARSQGCTSRTVERELQSARASLRTRDPTARDRTARDRTVRASTARDLSR